MQEKGKKQVQSYIYYVYYIAFNVIVRNLCFE